MKRWANTTPAERETFRAALEAASGQPVTFEMCEQNEQTLLSTEVAHICHYCDEIFAAPDMGNVTISPSSGQRRLMSRYCSAPCLLKLLREAADSLETEYKSAKAVADRINVAPIGGGN